MKAVSRSHPISRHPRLSGAVTLLFMAACATGPLSEEAGPSDAERVDIGYGTAEQEHVIGSQTTIESADGELAHFRSIAEMLARVPGVRVIERNGGLQVRIRGTNSFLAGEEPLYVVDGMALQGGIGSINPNDVENITVLKDAGSTAVYGTRGANGVILIRTKRGGG